MVTVALCLSHRGELVWAAIVNFAVQLSERFCCGLTAGKGKPQLFPITAGNNVHRCEAAPQNKCCLRMFSRLKF